MKKVLISIVLLFCLSCSPINTNPPYIGTPPNTLTPFLETPTITSTPTPVFYTSTTVVVTPKIQKICPCDRNVAFGDKDFSSISQLIIKKDDYWGLMDISNGKIESKANVDVDFHNFSASLDHHSFAYLETRANSTGDGSLKFLWVFTPVAIHSYELPPESDVIVWVNNQDIVVWDLIKGAGECSSFVAFINTITGETTHPTHFPDLSKTYCVQTPVINTQKSEIAYFWSKYNLVNGNLAQLLGFPEITPGGPTSFDMTWVGDKLAVTYWHSDYLLYGISIPDSTNTDESVNFQMLKIPLPKLATAEGGWWNPIVKLHQSEQSAIIGMDLIDKSIDPIKYFFQQEKPAPTNFYKIDIAQQQITDYELDRAVFSKTKSGTVVFSYVSPDERFLAWPIYEFPTTSKIIGSLILNLKSGKVLSILDVEVLGWLAP